MGHSRRRKSRSRITFARGKAGQGIQVAQGPNVNEKYFEIFVILALGAFGVYHSILYFGHKVVPNPDFNGFVSVGHELLSFKHPSNFDRGPVVGLLQAMLSYVVGGQYPDLTAGWLLNALLHPFNLVLLWLVGRQIVGGAGVWLAIIAILNGWVIYLLTEPIAETTLLFFTLLTFYFMFRRSGLAYLFASITMMTRYEGAALILACFVMDMIYCRTRRERIAAFLYACAATLPLVIWMAGMLLTWQSEGINYLVFFTKQRAQSLAQSGEKRTGLLLHLGFLWRVAFQPLVLPTSTDSMDMLWKLNKVLAFVGFFFGCGYGLYKRQWKILALLLFFVPYFLVHAAYPFPFQRFHMNIFWIALLICWFGWQSIWKVVNGDGRVPAVVVMGLDVLAAVIAIVWLFMLLPGLRIDSEASPASAMLPYVSMVLAGIVVGVRLYVSKPVRFVRVVREFAILAVVCLVIVSGQHFLVGLVGDGQRDSEFKNLADWYIANAKPGEKLGVYMAGVVKIFAPRYADSIVGLPKASGPSEFIKACYDANITYVVWATREGYNPANYDFYRQAGLDKNIAPLSQAQNTGPYQFVDRVVSKRGFVNIFRLTKPGPITLPQTR